MDTREVREHIAGWFKDEFEECRAQGLSNDQIKARMDDAAIKRIKWAMSDSTEHWRTTKQHIKLVLAVHKNVVESWIR